MTNLEIMPKGTQVRLTKRAMKQGVPPPLRGPETIGVVFRKTKDDWRRCVKWPGQTMAHYYAIEYLEVVNPVQS